MVKNRILYVLWLLMWLIEWMLGGNFMSACILVGSVAAAALEILLSAFVEKHLHIGLSTRLLTQKGESVTAEITVRNSCFLGCAAVDMHVCCRNLLTGERSEQSLRIAAAAKASVSGTVFFIRPHCGKIELSFSRLRVYDLFGLYGRRISQREHAFTLVLPELYPVELDVSEQAQLELDSNEYSMYRFGDDPSETFALREYIPGDRIKNIHWKLSEKSGEMIVRQLGLPVNHSILVLMDNSTVEPFTDVGLMEALGEMTASVSAALCGAGFSHQVAWYDRERSCIASVQVDSDDDLTQAFSALLAAQVAPDERSAAQHFVKESGPFAYAHVLILTLRGGQETLPVSDGGMVTFLNITAEMLNREGGVYLGF